MKPSITISENLMTEIRIWLRMKTTAYDDEVKAAVEACATDLYLAGVNIVDTEDALTKQAIKLYVKAFFGNMDMSDKFQKSYEHLKAAMSLSGEYKGVG